MDERANGVASDHAEQPQDDQYNSEGVQHKMVFSNELVCGKAAPSGERFE